MSMLKWNFLQFAARLFVKVCYSPTACAMHQRGSCGPGMLNVELGETISNYLEPLSVLLGCWEALFGNSCLTWVYHWPGLWSFVSGEAAVSSFFFKEIFEYFLFLKNSYLFYCSCPNFPPLPSSILSTSAPTVHHHSVVHVCGSFIHVLWLIPSPFFTIPFLPPFLWQLSVYSLFPCPWFCFAH